MTRKLTFLRLGLGALAALLAFGCGDSSPTAPTPPATEPASPTSVSPHHPPAANSAPVVFVRGGEQSCHPLQDASGIVPCRLRLTAYAQDPDNDRLTYSWSGCAVGEEPGADCVVDRLGTFSATVTVSDSHGATTVRGVELFGVNRAPTITLPGVSAYLRTHADVELYGELDDDDPVCGPDSFYMNVDARGACGPRVRLECYAREHMVMIRFATLDPGTCDLSVKLRDVWGRATETPFSFEVEVP